MTSKLSDKFSVLLPTYNERENLPIIINLIVKYMRNRLALLLNALDVYHMIDYSYAALNVTVDIILK